jgi:hypothetical protein
MVFSLYGRCLIGLTSDLSGIFISHNSPAIPFISVNVCGKKVAIFTQQFCDAFYCMFIPIISNAIHFGLLGSPDVNLLYLDWRRNDL